MRKVLLIHSSFSGCCNPLVTMLNKGTFGFPYSLFPRFPPLRFPPLHFCYSRVFHSRVFSRPVCIPCSTLKIIAFDRGVPLFNALVLCKLAMNQTLPKTSFHGLRFCRRHSVVSVSTNLTQSA